MSSYRYNFSRNEDSIDAAFILYPMSDEAACELANELLAQSGFLQVEVWKGSELLYEAGKDYVRIARHSN